MRNITFTIPETLGIIWKLGSSTSQIVITIAHDIGLLTKYDIKKNKKKIPVRTWISRGSVL